MTGWSLSGGHANALAQCKKCAKFFFGPLYGPGAGILTLKSRVGHLVNPSCP